MTLTEPLRTALANLQRKASGRDVDWVNIADARALVELGLAERCRSGWTITADGHKQFQVGPRAPGVVDWRSNVVDLFTHPH